MTFIMKIVLVALRNAFACQESTSIGAANIHC